MVKSHVDCSPALAWALVQKHNVFVRRSRHATRQKTYRSFSAEANNLPLPPHLQELRCVRLRRLPTVAMLARRRRRETLGPLDELLVAMNDRFDARVFPTGRSSDPRPKNPKRDNVAHLSRFPVSSQASRTPALASRRPRATRTPPR